MAARGRSRWTRTRLLDGALALAVMVVQLIDGALCSHGPAMSAWALPAAALASLPLTFRREAPIRVLELCVAGLFVAELVFAPYDTLILPIMVAVFTVAHTGDRRRSLLLALLNVPLVMLGVYIAPGVGFDAALIVTNLSLVLLAIAAGDVVRSRAEARSAERERIAQSERSREEEAERRVGEERLRIAREVHDVIAHHMVAINVQSGVAAHLSDSRPDAAQRALLDIKRVSGEALGDLRATLGLLRAPGEPGAPEAPVPGLQGLGDLADRMRTAGVEVCVERADDGRPLPSAVDAVGYRVVQEALTNVLRHSGARHADVRVAVGADAVEIEVGDDGSAPVTVGNAVSEAARVPAGSGLGLRGMRERVAAVGGRLEAGRDEAGGWLVHARLPVPPDA